MTVLYHEPGTKTLCSSLSWEKFQRFFQVNFLRAPSWPGFFRSLIRGSGVSSPACLIHSTSSSVTKLHKALAIAKRMAPACADLPPPETVQVTSCLSSRSRKWKGNINCSLGQGTSHGLSLLWRCDFVNSYKNQMVPAAVTPITETWLLLGFRMLGLCTAQRFSFFLFGVVVAWAE